MSVPVVIISKFLCPGTNLSLIFQSANDLCPLLTRRSFATRHSFESRSSNREIRDTALIKWNIIPGELIK